MVESVFIHHSNKKWFWTHINTEEQVEEVCKYLADNELQIEIKGDFSGGFKGSGVNVMLEGIDLSGNGHCFSGENLLVHVRYFRKLKELANTNDFKNWMEKYPKFDLVKRYIIQRDQRWIKEDQIKEIIKD